VVGGRAIRQLVLDPLLPEPIARADERAALVEALRRYDRLGRARWARFLARFDVPHLGADSAPAHLRLHDATRTLRPTGTE
jgi:phenylacetic acid degradation operon negative regulatory protein